MTLSAISIFLSSCRNDNHQQQQQQLREEHSAVHSKPTQQNKRLKQRTSSIEHFQKHLLSNACNKNPSMPLQFISLFK